MMRLTFVTAPFEDLERGIAFAIGALCLLWLIYSLGYMVGRQAERRRVDRFAPAEWDLLPRSVRWGFVVALFVAPAGLLLAFG